ncbi:MAG: polysaccharide biosynthesis protein, partial [Clostridia bacterium]|nr:polysaccharide biosynthesis protein [Clostridia bacterium]
MDKLLRRISTLLLVIWDVLSVGASVYLAIRLVYFTGLPNFYTTYLWYFIGGLSAVLVLFNLLFGCYNRVWSSLGFRDILFQVMTGVMNVGVLFLVDFAFRIIRDEALFPVNSYIIYTMMILILTVTARGFARFCSTMKYSLRANKVTATPVVVYGAGESGSYLQNNGGSGTATRIRVMAFIDDDPRLQGKSVGGVKIVGGFEKLEETIVETGVHQVIVAIPTADRKLLQNILDVCKKYQCVVKRFGTIDDASPSDMKVSDINLEDLLHRGSVHLNMDMVQSFIKDKVVLVSGGAGSIGSELCRQALRFGCKKLVVLDFNENGLFHIGNELEESGYHGRYELRLASIRDRDRLTQVFREFNPEIVFHAAAHKHVPMMELNPREAIKNNVLGTVNMCQVAITAGVKKFITISTDKAVNPTNIMGASKRITELIMQMMDTMADTEFAAVRFGNVLGSNGSVVPFFKKQIEKGGPVTVTHPEMRRYFMTIPEACQLVLEAGAMAGGGEIFVLDMGEPVLISDL